MTIHSALLLTSTILTVSRPMLQYGVCPTLENIENPTVNKICNHAVNITKFLPTIIGTTYGIFTIISNPVSLLTSFLANTHKYVLPAGLGMITANAILNPDHLPSANLFTFGTIKSAFEMTTAQKIAVDILQQNTNSPFFSISHPIFAGGITAVNIAQSTNTLYYTIKTMFDENNNLSLLENFEQGTNYALAYSSARFFYQVGSIIQDKDIVNMPLLGAGFFFAAPIVRGCFLSLSETGSVTVPGKKVDYYSNILDGIAIASTSLARTHLHNDISSDHSVIKNYSPTLEGLVHTIGAGNSLTIPFLAIIGLSNTADNSTEAL